MRMKGHRGKGKPAVGGEGGDRSKGKGKPAVGGEGGGGKDQRVRFSLVVFGSAMTPTLCIL